MTEEIPDSAREAFEAHEKITATEEGYAVDTTVFDGYVRASDGPDWKNTYTVTVFVPTLSAAAAEAVGPAVEDGWRDTLERRLGDAPQSTRAAVDLHDLSVEEIDDELQITFTFEFGNADRAAEIAKTFVEYVEGTYVEGIVPGYEYEPPVADLLSEASQADDSSARRGGTPL
ncbi:hypothetical protein GRX03_11410 [Halovenus sp. WSH3]|uniref:YbjN domain-containing protein n=1 Tax=Halovenus carboxidivorans TaxID=2692199 RepID=A0A6B0T7M1_9EURY|nr:DUF5813 family protein [Halovenus carboxidivorans]MXR52206.1 hypothetical protein [Halovenus carboxidivorans]